MLLEHFIFKDPNIYAFFNILRANISYSLLFPFSLLSSFFWNCPLYNQSDFGVDHLVMSMCSLFLCCWKRVFAMTSVFSSQNSISLCPALFCTPRPNLPVTPGVSWLPTFAFQSPIMNRTSFWVLVLKGLSTYLSLYPLSAGQILDPWLHSFSSSSQLGESSL